MATRAIGLAAGVGAVAIVTWAYRPGPVPSGGPGPVPVSVSVASSGAIEARTPGSGSAVLGGELVPGGPPLRGHVVLRNRLSRIAVVTLDAEGEGGWPSPAELRDLGIAIRYGSHSGPVILEAGESRQVPLMVALRDDGGRGSARLERGVAIRLLAHESGLPAQETEVDRESGPGQAGAGTREGSPG